MKTHNTIHISLPVQIGWKKKRKTMASTTGAIPTFFSIFSPTVRIPKPLLFSVHRPSHSFPSNCSSTHRTSPFLSPPLCRKWSPPPAAAADDTTEPEPVEVQIEDAAATANRKGEDVFAVVMIGSRQYIVIPGRFIYTQRLKGASVNDKVILNKVLLVGTKNKAYIGQPVVTSAAVHAVVEEQGLDKKVIVFKYKRKKNYRRNIGHRQPNTRIRITGITGYEDYPADTLPEPEAVAA